MLIQMTDRHDVRNWTKELRRTGGFEPNNYEDTGDYKGSIVPCFCTDRSMVRLYNTWQVVTYTQDSPSTTMDVSVVRRVLWFGLIFHEVIDRTQHLKEQVTGTATCMTKPVCTALHAVPS